MIQLRYWENDRTMMFDFDDKFFLATDGYSFVLENISNLGNKMAGIEHIKKLIENPKLRIFNPIGTSKKFKKEYKTLSENFKNIAIYFKPISEKEIEWGIEAVANRDLNGTGYILYSVDIGKIEGKLDEVMHFELPDKVLKLIQKLSLPEILFTDQRLIFAEDGTGRLDKHAIYVGIARMYI